jgi:hypothetical protein
MIGYDAMNLTLMIRFKTGDIYEYYKVDERTYEDLMKATSIGKYFTQNIRGKYEFKKIGNERDMLKI